MGIEIDFMYRCRLCGRTFSDVQTGAKDVCASRVTQIERLVDAIMMRPSEPQAPRMWTVHMCEKNSTGIADLIGSQEAEVTNAQTSTTNKESNNG